MRRSRTRKASSAASALADAPAAPGRRRSAPGAAALPSAVRRNEPAAHLGEPVGHEPVEQGGCISSGVASSGGGGALGRRVALDDQQRGRRRRRSGTRRPRPSAAAGRRLPRSLADRDAELARPSRAASPPRARRWSCRPTAPSKTSPVPPSMVIDVAGCEACGRRSDDRRRPRRRPRPRRRRPGCPSRGRRRRRGWRGRRVEVRMPAALAMPWTSSGEVSARTRMTARPGARPPSRRPRAW